MQDPRKIVTLEGLNRFIEFVAKHNTEENKKILRELVDKLVVNKFLKK